VHLLLINFQYFELEQAGKRRQASADARSNPQLHESHQLADRCQFHEPAAIEDVEYFETTRNAVISSRDTLTVGLQNLGFEVLPSAANFVFARHSNHKGADLAAGLRAKNILVRHFNKPRISDFLRITIGTDAQCAQLLNACRELVAH
jgi:hypothetical protein